MVLVDPPDDLLQKITAEINPHSLQLHGGETPERIAEIRSKYPAVKIIKALPVGNEKDLDMIDIFSNIADFLLFDAKPADKNAMHGGNGIAFDWHILSGKKIATPWFLSGGLNAGNITQAIKQSGAKFVDVSSGVENSPGVKDAELIKQFVKVARA